MRTLGVATRRSGDPSRYFLCNMRLHDTQAIVGVLHYGDPPWGEARSMDLAHQLEYLEEVAGNTTHFKLKGGDDWSFYHSDLGGALVGRSKAVGVEHVDMGVAQWPDDRWADYVGQLPAELQVMYCLYCEHY